MSAPKQRVLLTGASGYLGQHLLRRLLDAGRYEVHAAYGSLETFASDFPECICTQQLDLSSPEAVAECVARVQPHVLVHLAAISSPAACEKSPEHSLAVNCCAPLIEALDPSATIVFLSTDQVYDGRHAPYAEGSAAEPVNAYGRSKLEFEQLLASKASQRSVSLRSSLILGPPTPGRCRKQSFLQFCSERFESARLSPTPAPTQFFSDEVRSVVYVGDIVEVLLWAVDGGCLSHPGVYNMGGPQPVTRVDVARAVAVRQKADANTLIEPVARASLPPEKTGGVNSPPDITMDSAALVRIVGYPRTTLDELVRLSLAPPPNAPTPSS